MDRKPPRFTFIKRTPDNNDSLTTPIIDPNAPLSATGPLFPSFDHHTENSFGQYLQELSQSVSSDVYENGKQDKPPNLPTFPSPTTSSIPTPAIKYNHRHQQSQQSQVQSSVPLSPIQQTQNVPTTITNNHQLPNGSNVQSNNLNVPKSSNRASSPSPSDSKYINSPYQLSTSPSQHDQSNYLSAKQHEVDYVPNSSHISPIPVTVITTGCLSLTASATTTIAPHLSRLSEINQRIQNSTPVPSSSSSSSISATSLNLSNHNENSSTNTLTVSTEDIPSSSSRPNHVTLTRRHAPFSPVSTISTSSQASTVGKESVQYIVPSGSEDEQTSRATPGRKKKVDPNRRSKLTKKEKLDRIINEEKRLEASNSALKQKIKVMERDFNLLQTVITNILIDAAKRKRSESLRSRQDGSGETSS